METLFRYIDPVLVLFFRLHDWLTDFLVRHSPTIKRLLLGVSVLMLAGFFYPEARRMLGSWALNVLLVLLFLSPAAKVFRTRLFLVLMGFRRQMGILFGTLAIVHGTTFLLDSDWFSYFIAPYLGNTFFSMPPRILVGVIAFFLTFPLLLTSNTFSNRLLGKNWKRLHVLVYPLFVLVVFHKMFMGPAGSPTRSLSAAWLQSLFLIGAYFLFKILAWKGVPTLVSKWIDRLGNRYHGYRVECTRTETSHSQGSHS